MRILKKEEEKIKDFLLENGPSWLYSISQKLDIPPGTCYKVIMKLKEEGIAEFVREETVKGRTRKIYELSEKGKIVTKRVNLQTIGLGELKEPDQRISLSFVDKYRGTVMVFDVTDVERVHVERSSLVC